MEPFHGWENFYLIVGGAAGALIGLQFVVVTLIADRPGLRLAEAGAAFSTPTIVHFATVLALSALTAAPWPSIEALRFLWAASGVIGIVYTVFVIRHLRAQTVYQPVLEDWLAHVIAPIAAFVMLGIAGLLANSHVRGALFIVATSMLLFLITGIHNTWDAVTYHVFVQRAEEEPSAQPRVALRPRAR